MAAVIVQFEVHVLDERTGLWCDHCALPSVIEVDVALVAPTSLTVVARDTASVCTDCHRTSIQDRSDTT